MPNQLPVYLRRLGAFGVPTVAVPVANLADVLDRAEARGRDVELAVERVGGRDVLMVTLRGSVD